MTIFEALPELAKLIGKNVVCKVLEVEGVLESIVIDEEDVWYVIVDLEGKREYYSAVVGIEEKVGD